MYLKANSHFQIPLGGLYIHWDDFCVSYLNDISYFPLERNCRKLLDTE